ncbi:EF-hand calcium-binding domain-containing protein 12 [Acomys russatus]|uniref:EF-hand calcium-binding domain-containing protein 12 n=1 Tax=Acomys russatus TaxID=60746 RepID=UPI0021E2F663|nr:EF-hand calcium-binding domain-containing protein 12 [Acomys russatus]
MHPKLKKSGEVGCQPPVKFSAKGRNLRGRGRRRTKAAGRKTRVLRKSPAPRDASQRNAHPPDHQSLAESLAKYTGRRGAKLGESQKTEGKNVSRVTFNFTTADLGPFSSLASIDDDTDETSQGPVFNPERVTAHCFRQLKQKDFRLPQSRWRVIIVSGIKDQVLAHPTLPLQPPPPPVPSFKALDLGAAQEPPLDRMAWLSQKAQLRRQLETFGDVRTWLENKAAITPSEAKVLLRVQQEQNAPKDTLISVRTPKVEPRRTIRQPIPQLRLPKPSILSHLFAYLRSQKIKVLEVFNKVDLGEKQRITREEFIMAMKAIGVPLTNQELEDVIIYLGSLGKQNAITTDALVTTYKQWSLAQQRSTVPTAREYYNLSIKRTPQKRAPQKQQAVSSPVPPTMDLLKVPEVDTKTERRPMTEEDMEDVGKRYRERRRQAKLCIPSIQYMENCRLVRSGIKQFDDHCLPSTLSGEMEELINKTRRDVFLVYLQCWELCEVNGLPLTEDLLRRALLYPGDKIITLKEEVRPIRQPGGYYIDERIFYRLPGFKTQGHQKLGEKKADKKTMKLEAMHFEEFEEFTGKLKAKRPRGPTCTHPNHFWPGHLLEKLRLYLPTVAKDKSLAIFSRIEQTRHAYPASYHSKDWWPMKDWAYMTHAYYDANKVYSIN